MVQKAAAAVGALGGGGVPIEQREKKQPRPIKHIGRDARSSIMVQKAATAGGRGGGGYLLGSGKNSGETQKQPRPIRSIGRDARSSTMVRKAAVAAGGG